MAAVQVWYPWVISKQWYVRCLYVFKKLHLLLVRIRYLEFDFEEKTQIHVYIHGVSIDFVLYMYISYKKHKTKEGSCLSCSTVHVWTRMHFLYLFRHVTEFLHTIKQKLYLHYHGAMFHLISNGTVVLRLILGHDVEQLIFNAETMLLISTSGKQPIFNVVSTSDFNVEATSDSTLKQLHISMLKQRQISTLKQRHILTLKQRHISTLIHFNKIEYLFNVEVRRCFNLVSTCICLLGGKRNLKKTCLCK